MSQPEVWLRGPLPQFAPLLQPVAHSLLQCREEMVAHVTGLTADQIWARPGGAASIGFHARHAAGSLDRLLTYARGEALSPAQLTFLHDEHTPDTAPDISACLIAAFHATVEQALAQLRTTSEGTLLEGRPVGRAHLPSTVAGLLFHAAEHTQRHLGQIATTARIVRSGVTTSARHGL